MAILRHSPKCPHCGESIATGRYKDQSNVPPMKRIYGDTFLGWEYHDHTCKESIAAKKKQ